MICTVLTLVVVLLQMHAKQVLEDIMMEGYSAMSNLFQKIKVEENGSARVDVAKIFMAGLQRGGGGLLSAVFFGLRMTGKVFNNCSTNFAIHVCYYGY